MKIDISTEIVEDVHRFKLAFDISLNECEDDDVEIIVHYDQAERDEYGSIIEVTVEGVRVSRAESESWHSAISDAAEEYFDSYSDNQWIEFQEALQDKLDEKLLDG